MTAITIERLRQRIARDPRQWGAPFEQQVKTLGYVEADPTLRICPDCEGEQGHGGGGFSFYSGCSRCGGRGVLRRWLPWLMGQGKPLPPSFYEERQP